MQKCSLCCQPCLGICLEDMQPLCVSCASLVLRDEIRDDDRVAVLMLTEDQASFPMTEGADIELREDRVKDSEFFREKVSILVYRKESRMLADFFEASMAHEPGSMACAIYRRGTLVRSD